MEYIVSLGASSSPRGLIQKRMINIELMHLPGYFCKVFDISS